MDRDIVQNNLVQESKAEIGHLNRVITIATLIWSVALALIFYSQSGVLIDHSMALAYNAALTNFNKDQSLRFWASSHGGVYVPISEHTPPNPYLSHLPERDVSTASGLKLTLMNPSYILREVATDHAELFGNRGHVTSLKPLNPDNAPDQWERRALEQFEQGAKEVSEETEIKGEPYYRFMRPMITQKGCLKCHADQGYKVGDIRGGVSVSIDMVPYLAYRSEGIQDRIMIISMIWLIGLFGIFYSRYRVLQGILARQLSQRALQESEEKFRGISDSAQDAITLLNPQGNICYWNRAAEKIFGYANDEIIGKNFHQLLVPEHYQKDHKSGWEQFLKTGKGAVVGKTIELAALRKGGHEFPVELSVSAIKLQDEWRAVGIIRDISDRVSVEHDLANISDKIIQSHREWVDAFDSIHAPIFLHDADGLITRANQAYADHAEMEVRDLIGKPYWECFPKREGPLPSCTEMLENPHAEELNEEIVLEGGEIFLSRATAITNIDGSYRYSVHIMEDITFERQAKGSLEESERRFRKLFQHAP
ncbi:MAG: PAS domain S-box protein, partial [Chromatiales bacterium]|nr:PAS domain S-box protein [Chromatiales bacterium]